MGRWSLRKPGAALRVNAACVIALTSGAVLNARADAPASGAAKYASLFGAEDKAVAATASVKDDVKFANTLVEKARSLSDEPELLSLMYSKAYALGSKDPDGYAAAVTALKRLAEVDPKAAPDLKSKLTELYRLQMSKGRPAERAEAAAALAGELTVQADALAAEQKLADAIKRYKEAASAAQYGRSPRLDEINLKIKAATARQQLRDKIEKLRPRAEAGDAAAAKEMFNLYLCDLDDPAGAAKVRGAADEKAAELLALAAGRDDGLTEPQLMQLAEWYQSQSAARGLTPAARGTLLGRSLRYYARFLDVHEKQDTDRVKAQEAMEQVSKALNAAGGPGQTADRIVLWNTHDSVGTAAFNLILSYRGSEVWRRENVEMPWDRARDMVLTVPAPRTAFDHVRVEVVRVKGDAGGFGEIQVFKGQENIALQAPVKVSGTWDATFPGSALTDGITKPPGNTNRGAYWLGPNGGKPAWAEIDLNATKKGRP